MSADEYTRGCGLKTCTCDEVEAYQDGYDTAYADALAELVPHPLDAALAGLAEVVLGKRVSEHVAAMAPETYARLAPAGRMAARYAENALPGGRGQ